MVQVIGSGYFAQDWSEANHNMLPAVLASKFAVVLMCIGLPGDVQVPGTKSIVDHIEFPTTHHENYPGTKLLWDVQKDLAEAYWQVFIDSSMCHIDTLRALEQCIPSDDETAMIESYVEAFSDSKLAEAEKFMLHVSHVPRYIPPLSHCPVLCALMILHGRSLSFLYFTASDWYFVCA